MSLEAGAFLHRFSWIKDDALIGKIDYEWNFLVGPGGSCSPRHPTHVEPSSLE
jgi:hypothetical protein